MPEGPPHVQAARFLEEGLFRGGRLAVALSFSRRPWRLCRQLERVQGIKPWRVAGESNSGSR